MAYTPSSTFTFSAGSYTPGNTFAFSHGEAVTGTLTGTLDGVTGAMTGIVASVAGRLAGTLGGVSGELAGHVAPQGVLSGALDGISGQLIGNVVPQGVLTGALDGLSGVMYGFNVAVAGRISGTLDGISGQLTGHYDPNVLRQTVGSVLSIQQDGRAIDRQAALLQQQTHEILAACHAPRDMATPNPASVRLPFGKTTKAAIRRCGTVADATPLDHAATAAFDLLAWHTLQRTIRAEQAQALSRFAAVVAQQMTKIRPPDWRQPVQDMAETITHFTKTVYGDPANPYTPGGTFIFVADPGYTPNAPFEFLDAPTPIVWAMRHVRGIDGLTFVAPRQQAGPHKIKRCLPVQDARRPPPGTSIPPTPERPPYEPPPGQVTLTIPTQTVYTMQHVISVKTVPGNVDVPVGQVNLNYDADSFAWQFGATLLDANALNLVTAVGGNPVTLAVSIDGLVWHVLVESIEHGIQFAKHTISLKGRSLTALLGAPYVLPASATQGSDLTVQQLAETLMPVGWTLNWNAPTWIVPAGAWSYTNQTPIQALAGLVADIGCVAVPHNSLQQITVQPRYPVYPWYFSAAPVDLAVPEAALKQVSLRPAIATQANGVYVHGGDIGGVLAWCRLAGSAGDRLAPTVSNALMTDVIGCRLVGERILSGQWQQPIVKSATLPLDNDTFPLTQVGQLVAITLGGDIIKGIINSVAIDANLTSVSQSIQIGEETANVWTSFTSLLPRDPLLVGTISSTDGTLSVVTLLDGGVVSVRGTGAVGGKVYIRTGRIEGPAPAMGQNEIVI